MLKEMLCKAMLLTKVITSIPFKASQQLKTTISKIFSIKLFSFFKQRNG